MDDAFQVFGVKQPLSQAEELWHREQQRRSFDIIRVKNPDGRDFSFDWDKRWYMVPARGTADLMRYLAVTYVRNKAIDTINKLADKLHAQDIADRQAKGQPAFQSKYDENKETYQSSRYPKTNDKELLTKLYSEYWVGLVSEFGKDAPPPVEYNEPVFDMTPLEMKIINDLQMRRVDITEKPPVKQETVFKQKFEEKPLVKEVTIDETEPEK